MFEMADKKKLNLLVVLYLLIKVLLLTRSAQKQISYFNYKVSRSSIPAEAISLVPYFWRK